MPIRINGGVFSDQMLTGSLVHYVVCGADFSGAINQYGQPVPFSAAEIIFNQIEASADVDIMNPNQYNLSFALEADRSTWNEITLTNMIQSLGNDVGVDHVNCTLCTVKEVPYIWGCGTGSATTFLDLTDTPNTYVGAAGYVVTVNEDETGLIFTPAQSVGSLDYTPVTAGTILSVGIKYFVTSSGVVTLPDTTIELYTAGQSVTVAKPIGIGVFVDVGNVDDIIATSLGITDSIEMDSAEQCIFIFDGTSTWNLQIGSIN